MTYRDPNAPIGADTPTEAYRAPADPAAPTGPTPAQTSSWPSEAPPATATTPATPATPAGAPRRPSRARWAAAIAVVALVVVASGVAAVLLTGRAPDSEVVSWAPSGSIIYGEVRLDLPGDQRAKLGEFLSRFPGFEDQAAFDTKVDEVLDRIVSSASDGEQTYTRDIDPWFGGELAFSIGELPDPAMFGGAESDPDAFHGLVMLSLKDAAAADAWFGAAFDEETTGEETYEGVGLTLFEAGDGSSGPTGALAIAGDRVALLGDVASVKQAIDTGGEGGLSKDENFAAALAAGDDDHVGFVYIDMGTYFEWAMDLSAEMSGTTGAMGLTEQFADLMPAWTAFRVRAEGDALVMDSVSPAPAERMGATENRASTLTSRVPASALFYAELHDYGKTLQDSLALYEEDPAMAEDFRMLESTLAMFGGLDGLVGWIGDVAFVVDRTDDGGVEGGLLVTPTEASNARNLLLTLRSILQLGGAELGATVSDETYGDATITTLDLGDLATLMQLSGSVPPGAEGDLFGEPGAHVQLSWTVTDDLVVFGVGPDFVKHVLDTDTSASLAEDARFKGLLERAGTSNSSISFVDVAAVREMIEPLLAEDPDALAHYEREIKPFLEPFDAMIASSVLGSGDSLDQGTTLITVK